MGKCRLTLSSRGRGRNTGVQPFSHVPQWSVAEAGQETPSRSPWPLHTVLGSGYFQLFQILHSVPVWRGEEEGRRWVSRCRHPPTPHLSAGDGGLGHTVWEVWKGVTQGCWTGWGALKGGQKGLGKGAGGRQGRRHNGKIGLQRLCWAPRGLTVGFWEGTQEGDRLGLEVSSRHKRNRVSSPAHSRTVASPNSASCTPCPQHLRLLENFGNSAGSGENARRGRLRLGLAMPVSPSPRAPKPRRLSRAHTKAVDLRGPPASSVRLPSCLSCPPVSAPCPDFVPLCIHASLSLQLSSPTSGTPSVHAPVVSKPASGPGHCPERQAQDQELRPFRHRPIRWLTPTQLSP